MNFKEKLKKKSLSTTIGVILLFGFLIFIYLLFTFGIKALFIQEVLEPTEDILVDYGSSQDFSAEQITTLRGITDDYYEDFLNLDVLFLIFFIGLFTGTIVSANKSRKLGIFSFFGWVTIGSVLFIFLLSYIEKVRVWLFENVLYNIFEMQQFSTPIINYFVNNIQWISLIWLLLILLINQIDIIDIIGVRRMADEGRIEE